jgi:hypothetical protein
MSNELAGGDWDVYFQAFREDAHKLLAWGYADSRKHITADDDEEVITTYIARAIDQRIDDAGTPDKFSRYSIHNVHFVSPGGQTGKRQLKLDLMLEQCGIRPKRHFVFEAKRLKTCSHPIGKYTGADGLGRLVTGRYAARHPEAAMVGYIQNSDAAYWFSELDRAFTGDQSSGVNTLRIVDRLRKIRVLPELLNEWSSTHNRPSGTRIRVFHILLNCSQTTIAQGSRRNPVIHRFQS